MQAGLACLVGLICGFSFLTVSRDNREATTGLLIHSNMQWPAFTKFQKIRPDIVIPINSPWPVYPPLWNVQIRKSGAEVRSPDYEATRSPIPLLSGRAYPPADSPDVMNGEGIDGGSMASKGMHFDIGNYCTRSPRIASLKMLPDGVVTSPKMLPAPATGAMPPPQPVQR